LDLLITFVATVAISNDRFLKRSYFRNKSPNQIVEISRAVSVKNNTFMKLLYFMCHIPGYSLKNKINKNVDIKMLFSYYRLFTYHYMHSIILWSLY